MNESNHLRLKHLVRVPITKREFNKSTDQFVGLEHIEPWTGRVLVASDAEPTGQVVCFEKGDVLFGRLRPYLAKVALADADGVATTEALILRSSGRLSPEFLRFAMTTRRTIDEINSSTFGAQMPRASWDFIGTISIYVPSPSEQRQIVDNLQTETVKIDQLIAAKQKQILRLLELQAAELDQATFHSADAANWLRIPFRWVCRIPNGQVDPREQPWSDMPLIAPNHIEGGTGRVLSLESAQEQGAISGKYTYPAGTVIYSKIRPGLAKACIAESDGLCSADMYPILPDARLKSTFLLMQLLSQTFTEWAKLESMRVAMPKLNRDTLGSFKLVIPPILEQERLAQRWMQRKTVFEGLIDKISRSIDLLRERRIALVTYAIENRVEPIRPETLPQDLAA